MRRISEITVNVHVDIHSIQEVNNLFPKVHAKVELWIAGSAPAEFSTISRMYADDPFNILYEILMDVYATCNQTVVKTTQMLNGV